MEKQAAQSQEDAEMEGGVKKVPYGVQAAPTLCGQRWLKEIQGTRLLALGGTCQRH